MQPGVAEAEAFSVFVVTEAAMRLVNHLKTHQPE
jgi:hypothetical protein